MTSVDPHSVDLPSAETATLWWCPTREHSDLSIEPLPLDPGEWVALSRLPSQPVTRLVADTLPEDVEQHDEQAGCGLQGQGLCQRLDRATAAYHQLHRDTYRRRPGFRFDIQDEGLLVGRGRAWPLARVVTSAADADRILKLLDQYPAAVRVDEWDEDPESEGDAQPETHAQVVVPFVDRALEQLDVWLESQITGTPPLGRPLRYAVQITGTRHRVFAVTQVLRHGQVLRALLTTDDEGKAMRMAHLLNAVLLDPSRAQDALDEAQRVLSPSSAKAVAAEIVMINDRELGTLQHFLQSWSFSHALVRPMIEGESASTSEARPRNIQSKELR